MESAVRRITPLLCLAWSLAALSAVTAGDVERLQYRGQLVQQTVGGESVPVRSFGVVAWVQREGAAPHVLYRVDDEGRGALPWWNRIGRMDLAETTPQRPQLRHLHLDRAYTLSLPGPLAVVQPLTAESEFELSWEGRRTEFGVTGEQRLGSRDCWEVSGDGGNGRRQTWMVEKSTNVIVKSASRVFIGQGERYELQLELEHDDAPADDAAPRELAVALQLADLRQSLNLDDGAAGDELNAEQLANVEAALPALAAAAQGTTWDRFVQSIGADAAASRERGAAIQKLAERIVGQPAPGGTLVGVDGRPIAWPAAGEAVVVLHFWDYRGQPESPFGQVGYLDFLAGKLQGKPVRVIGVAVDERAADPQQLRAVRREVKKFSTEFIRLAYPIAIDDGSLLAGFGDPRPLNTPLPLWIVIGQDGRVAHFRTGLYAIDPNRGLTELFEAVSALLSAK